MYAFLHYMHSTLEVLWKLSLNETTSVICVSLQQLVYLPSRETRLMNRKVGLNDNDLYHGKNYL